MRRAPPPLATTAGASRCASFRRRKFSRLYNSSVVRARCILDLHSGQGAPGWNRRALTWRTASLRQCSHACSLECTSTPLAHSFSCACFCWNSASLALSWDSRASMSLERTASAVRSASRLSSRPSTSLNRMASASLARPSAARIAACSAKSALAVGSAAVSVMAAAPVPFPAALSSVCDSLSGGAIILAGKAELDTAADCTMAEVRGEAATDPPARSPHALCEACGAPSVGSSCTPEAALGPSMPGRCQVVSSVFR
eukprot:scaffold30462_cov28-Tisochrysis_lutea.AAC.7